MLNKPFSNSDVVFTGLADTVASQLAIALQSHPPATCRQVVPTDWATFLSQSDAEFIFCAAEPATYIPVLEAARLVKPGLRVIVVSESADVAGWLEALESGAADYCAPPFEPAQIHWIIESALKSCPSARMRRIPAASLKRRLDLQGGVDLRHESPVIS